MEYIHWEVSLSIVKQLVHVKLRAANVWTIEPPPPIAPQAERAIAAAETTRQQMQW